MSHWYCEISGSTAGPFTLEELKFLAARGQLSAEDRVKQDATGPWLQAASVRGLFALTVPVSSPQPEERSLPSPPTEVPATLEPKEAENGLSEQAGATLNAMPGAPPPGAPPFPVDARRTRLTTRILIGSGIGAGLVLLALLLVFLLQANGPSTATRGNSSSSGRTAENGAGFDGQGEGHAGGNGRKPAPGQSSSVQGGGEKFSSNDQAGQHGAGGESNGEDPTSAEDTSDSSSTEDSSQPSQTADQPAPEECVSDEPPPDRGTFSIQPLASPEGGGGGLSDRGGSGADGRSWEELLKDLRRHGLDIVITFDSTGSMGGEIHQVKEQINRIGTTLFKLVPKTQISICTYRDLSDAYVVKGLPLTEDIKEIEDYLAGIAAGGGGDGPEAVQEGLRWAVESNKFRSQARKVVLLFGDAPPHPQDLKDCLKTASRFRRRNRGIVSTVTCRMGKPMPDFVQIAEAGGGEAFMISNQREIMTQLMVLVFGSRHRRKVLEAFRLMER